MNSGIAKCEKLIPLFAFSILEARLMNNTSKPSSKIFRFKQFEIQQEQSSMKVGTDGVLLGAWVPVGHMKRILDIGCGSGLITLMLAQRNSTAIVHGIEIDELSWREAKGNAAACPWAARIHLFHQSIQEYAGRSDSKYDLIISNPPFFSGGTFSANHDRNQVRHTIKLSHGDLLASARQLLQPEGKFCVILPFIEGLRFQELANQYGLFCTHQTEVQPHTNKSVHRLLLQFERQQQITQKDSLIIQKGGRHEYTDAYIALTKDFYLNM